MIRIIVLMIGLCLVLSCTKNKIVDACDQNILVHYDARPIDGDDVGCHFFVVKTMYSEINIYHLDRTCTETGQGIILEPLHIDCNRDIVTGPTSEFGAIIQTEIIGIVD